MENKRTIITVPCNSYNDFCYRLSRSFIDVDHVKQIGRNRFKFVDSLGRMVATYDERKDHGLVYDYHTFTHSPLLGKSMAFPL